MPRATLGKLVAAPLWEPSLERLLVEEREQPLARVLAVLPAPAQPQPPANVLRSFSRKPCSHSPVPLLLRQRSAKTPRNQLRRNLPNRIPRNHRVRPPIRMTLRKGPRVQ